jgi:hypothetical protein
MISRFQDKRNEQVSISLGFEYKLNSSISIIVDDEKFELLTNKNKAFARNSAEDAALIQKILESAEVKARADSSIGTFAIDEYNLKGVAKAYSRIKEICK